MPRESSQPLFTDKDGNSMCFFIDPSVKKEHVKRQLIEDIESNGGTVIDTDEGADTVIAWKDLKDRQTQQLIYGCSSIPGRNLTFVEHPSWVRLCIKRGECIHQQPERKGMGGGIPRREFTEEEEENLCAYIAKRIPNGAAGGRRGHGIYRELVRMGEQSRPGDEFYWANNHTWQSWRNRFNKHFHRLDARVDQIASQLLPAETEPYHLDRRLNKRVPAFDFSDEEDGEEFEAVYDDGEKSDEGFQERSAVRQPKRSRMERTSLGQGKRRRVVYEEEEEEELEEEIPRGRHGSSRPTPLFSSDESYVSLALSEVEAGPAPPLFQLAPEDDSNPPDDFDFEDPTFERSNSEELLPPPSQAFGPSQTTLVGDPNSPEKPVPSSVSGHRRPRQEGSPVPESNPQTQRRFRSERHSERLPAPSARDALSTGKRVKPRPKKPTPRRRASTPLNDDGPARNTRARSRSISVEPTPVKLPESKRKKQTKLQPVEEVPQESEDEENQLDPSDDEGADELDVLDQLVPEETGSHVSKGARDHIAQREEEEEHSAWDSDDAQIDEALRRPGPPEKKTSQFPSSNFTPGALKERNREVTKSTSHKPLTSRKTAHFHTDGAKQGTQRELRPRQK